MLVKEIMAKNVVTTDPEKSVFDVCNIYKEKKVGSLIVIKDNKCVGMVTERDIIERTICAKKDPIETKVKDIMSSDIISVHPLDKLETAIEFMEFFNIKKLPVVQNEEVVGIITVTDISKARPDLSERFVETWVRARWKD